MNKKPAIYVATAVLLGFAIMMLPQRMQPLLPISKSGENNYTDTLSPFAGGPRTSEGDGESIPYFHGLASQPSNLLPSSLILFFGLAVALCVYLALKKRLA